VRDPQRLGHERRALRDRFKVRVDVAEKGEVERSVRAM
jgi:hypothetical protein